MTHYTVMGSTDPSTMEGTADQISDQLRQERIAAVLLSPVGFVCTRAVSALAHMLETHGTPTVAIGLVRPRIDRSRPPRGLWTPFQLGWLLDEPGDSEFQRRVLLRALGLLERGDGPVILEDFPDDPPNWFDALGWQPPSLPAIEAPASSVGWEAALASEMAELRPAWQRARARYRRTTTRLSGQAPEPCRHALPTS